MIPEIGLMVGAYIITRMLRMALRREPKEHMVVVVCSLLTIVIAGFVIADLMARGTTLGQSLPGLAATAPAASTSSLPQYETFGVGSTKDDVLRIQGTPNASGPNIFVYGDAAVMFEDGGNARVVSWRDPNGKLHTKK